MTLHIYDDLIQGTDEWLEARRGIVTASTVGQLITVGPPAATSVACPDCTAAANSPCVSRGRKVATPIKSIHEARTAAAASRPPVYEVADNETSRGLTLTLAAERITGWTEDTFMNADMIRGVESEPFAREVYADNCDDDVTEVGFMRRDEKGWTLGYSPDGLVGDDGLIEIKSPRAKTHLNTILRDEVPAHYMPQLQAGLFVSGRQWIDFVSYVGGMPLYVKRVQPDPKWHAAIEAAVYAFEANVAAIVADYETRVDGLPTTERINNNLDLVF